MKSHSSRPIAVLSLLITLALPVSVAAQQTGYKLIDLGTLGGPQTFVALLDNKEAHTRVLNNLGEVAGTAETANPDPDPGFCFTEDCQIAHAFRWNAGIMADLGVLPGNTSSGFSVISSNGLVAGVSENADQIDPLLGFPEFHAVLWRNGKIVDLGALRNEGGHSSVANSVNSWGRVVGGAFNSVPDPDSLLGVGYETRAFLWQNGVMRDLGTLGGPDAQALLINDNGQIVGDSYTSYSPNNCNTGEVTLTLGAFIWENGKMTDLGNLGGACTFAIALNNRGQVTGTSTLPGDQVQHPFFWERGSMRDLGTFGGNFASGEALNDAGTVVGYSTYPGDQMYRAALWTTSKRTDLGTLPGDTHSFAFDINARDQIVGVSADADFTSIRAFFWEKGRQMLDLDAMIAGSGLSLGLGAGETGVLNINDGGEIAGNAVDANGNMHAVLLVPCDSTALACDGPEPGLAQFQSMVAVENAPAPNSALHHIPAHTRFPRVLRPPLLPPYHNLSGTKAN